MTHRFTVRELSAYYECGYDDPRGAIAVEISAIDTASLRSASDNRNAVHPLDWARQNAGWHVHCFPSKASK